MADFTDPHAVTGARSYVHDWEQIDLALKDLDHELYWEYIVQIIQIMQIICPRRVTVYEQSL